MNKIFATSLVLLAGCGASNPPATTEPAPVASAEPALGASAEPAPESEAPLADESADSGEPAPLCKDAACAKACDEKKTMDLCEEAMRYFEGKEVPADKIGENGENELKYAKMACDLGSAFGCTKAGDLTSSGFGEFLDDKKYAPALALYEKGCDLKDSYACHLAASQYLDGKGTKKDAAKAYALEAKRCGVGKSPEIDCEIIREALGKKNKDAGNAVDAIRKQCKGGDAAACETEKRIDT